MIVSLGIFLILLILIFIGVPIAFSIGLASLATIYLFDLGIPLTLLPAKTFSGMDSFSLMAIPFFILAGEIMNKAGITRRIIDLADACVGFLKGGLSYVNVVSAMLMAGVSGSGTADAAALGVVMIPNMEEKGYSKQYAVALTSCANTIGPIIPPSTLLILYGYYTNTSVAKLFIGGIFPGIIMGLSLMIVAQIICRKKGYRQVTSKFSKSHFKSALIRGWVALLAPTFILVAIILGWATPSEAGVLVCVFALILGLFYKTIRSLNDIKEIVISAARSTCTIFTLLAFSGIFANILVRAHFQGMIVSFLQGVGGSPTSMLIMISIFIFILGMFVDVTPMIIMFSAAFAGVAVLNGINIVHFGLVFVLICMIGAVTPPVGGLLFVTTSIGKVSMQKVTPVLIPFVAVLFGVVVLLIFFPSLVTYLPNLIMGN